MNEARVLLRLQNVILCGLERTSVAREDSLASCDSWCPLVDSRGISGVCSGPGSQLCGADQA